MSSEMIASVFDMIGVVADTTHYVLSTGSVRFSRWIGDYRGTTIGFSDLKRDISWLTDLEAMLILSEEMAHHLSVLSIDDLPKRAAALPANVVAYGKEGKATAQKQLGEFYTLRHYLQEARKTKEAARALISKIQTRDQPLTTHEQEVHTKFVERTEELWIRYDEIKSAAFPIISSLASTFTKLGEMTPRAWSLSDLSTWQWRWSDLPTTELIRELYFKHYPTLDETESLYILLSGILYYLPDDASFCIQKNIPLEKKVLLQKLTELADRLCRDGRGHVCPSHHLEKKPAKKIVATLATFYDGKVPGDTESDYSKWAVNLARYNKGERSHPIIDALCDYNKSAVDVAFTMELVEARRNLTS